MRNQKFCAQRNQKVALEAEINAFEVFQNVRGFCEKIKVHITDERLKAASCTRKGRTCFIEEIMDWSKRRFDLVLKFRRLTEQSWMPKTS